MIVLGVWLGVVGLCDLLRAVRDVVPLGRRVVLAGVGLALYVLAAVLLAETARQGLLLVVVWSVPFLLWLLGSSAALVGRRTVARAVAFVGLGAGVLAGLVLDDPEVSRHAPGALGAVELDLLVLVVGVALVQLATANVAIRILLDAVGVPASTNEKQLKGGRLLGPMERLFIVGLGLAGQLTAAGIVVAAKGLLRFPELQRGARAGPSDLSEYFLIGSLASWLLALGGLGLVALRTLT